VTADQILSARNQGTGASLELNPGPITISNSKFCNNVTGIEDARSNYVTLSSNQLFGNSTAQLMFTGSGTPVDVPDWETGVVNSARSAYHVYSGNTVVGSGTVSPTWGWLLWGPFGSIYTTYFRPTIRSTNNTWYHQNQLNGFALDDLSGGINFWTADYALLKSTSHWNHPSNPNSPNNEAGGRWANPGALSCTMP
jgi:hypothetical protein